MCASSYYIFHTHCDSSSCTRHIFSLVLVLGNILCRQIVLHLEWRNLDLVWELYCELSSTQLELQLGGKTSDHLLALCTIAVCNRQQYTNPRLSAFMIKLQYHLLPLKLGLRSDKVQSTKSTPPIHLLYALIAWGCDTFTLPLPRYHRFTFPTGSTLTILLPIVATLCCPIESVQSDHLM